MRGKATKTFEVGTIERGRKSPARTTFVPRTEMGRRLWRIRQRILTSGQLLLDWEDLEEIIARCSV